MIALGILPAAVGAAPRDYEGKPVVEISFSPEKQPYPRAYLLEILPLKINQPLRLASVRAAIERLFATGRYEDIQVEAEGRDGGVALRFITKQEYFIGRVSAEGVPEPPNQGVLVNATRLELGARFERADIAQATANLREVLQSNGFYESRIQPRFEYDPDTQQVHIHFVIDPGERARYAPPAVTGDPQRSAEQLIKATHWRGWFGRWKAVTESRTQEGVDRLRRSYQERDRLMAQVALTGMEFDQKTRRVAPALQVEAGPKVRIVVEGAKVSKGRLRRLVPVFQEGSVDRDLLIEGAANLTEYFQSQGYFHAKVNFEQRAVDGGEQLIVFDVDRGERHRVTRVEIKGNRYFDTDTIRERMYIRPASLLQFRHGRYGDQLLERDLEAIRSLYRSNGFRDVQVRSRVEHGHKGKKTNMAVYIEIDEGPQWLVGGLELEGVSQANREQILSLLQSSEGQPFSEFNISIDRENVLEYYNNNGYPNATFEWSFEPAAEPNRVRLKFVITEGPRKFVRDVLIGKLKTTDPDLVRERILLRPGQPLSRADLLATQRRLYNLQIFSRVDTALQNPSGDERDKYVLLQMDESRRYTITTGFGAEIAKIGGSQTSFEAPAGEAGFSPRVSFDVARLNMWGHGHTVSLRTRASTLQKRGILTYEAPQFRGTPDLSLLFSAMYDDSRDVRTFSARRQEGSVQLGQRLSRANTMLYRFIYRRVTVDPQTLKISPLLIPLYSQPVRLGILAGNFVQDRRDDPTDSHRGIYNTLDAGWASRLFGSETDFTRILGHNATYHPFSFGNRFVLARALSFGWLQTLRETDKEIPLPERFFAGGPDSHRGFPQNQAGPRDLLTGFPLGGRALLINKVELRFPLIGENIGGVIFEDAGNLYSGLNKMSLRVRQKDLTDFDYMVHAVGFGVRYRTPIGPVRLDVAYSFNPPRFVGFKGTREELLFGGGERTLQRLSHFQFHFSLGQSF